MPTKEDQTVEVSLDNLVMINGVKYEAGKHKLPADVAEDLKRLDSDHNKYLNGLNKNSSVNGSLGSISAS